MGSGKPLRIISLALVLVTTELVACSFFYCRPFGPEKRGFEMHENNAIYYTITIGDSPFSQNLKIDYKGVASFLTTYNFQPDEPREIGLYQMDLGEETHEGFWNLVHEVNFPDIDTSNSLPEEGEGTRMITVVEENRTIAKLIGQRDKAPEGFKELEQALRDLIQNIFQHPVYALRMETSLSQGNVINGRSAEIQIRLSNPGKEQVTIVNPVFLQTLGAGDFELDILRSDIPVIELRDQHHFLLSLGKADLFDLQPESQRDAALIELLPGGELNLRLKVKINWPPGSYQVQVIYTCQEERIEDKQVLSGQIDSLPMPMVVLPPE